MTKKYDKITFANFARKQSCNHSILTSRLRHQQPINSAAQNTTIGRVSNLILVSMRHYVLTTSGDIVICLPTAACLCC